LAATAAALDGWTVLYLGVEMPAADVVVAATSGQANAVALSIVRTDDEATLVRELRAIVANLPSGIPLLVGGAGAVGIAESLSKSGIIVCESMGDMRRVLARQRTRSEIAGR
jgi:methylmalonyl-CoA mutase cobalamin-binding subunit